MANTKFWFLDQIFQKIFDEVTSRIKVDASITGSLTKETLVRNQSVNAGAYANIATFNSSDGVKRVTAGIRADATHSFQFYLVHQAVDTGIAAYNNEGSGAVSGVNKAFDYTVKSGKAVVTYQNADAVSHIINADCLGWTN